VSLPVDSEGKSARVLNGNNKEGPQAEEIEEEIDERRHELCSGRSDERPRSRR